MAAIIVIQNHYHSNIMLDVTVNTPHVTQTQTFHCLIYSVSCHSKYLRVKRGEKKGKKQDVPCSFICLICFTVSFRIAHLSGLTLKLSMSLKLAKISSASSSMYLFSCSRFRFSLLRLGLKKKKYWIECGCHEKR